MVKWASRLPVLLLASRERALPEIPARLRDRIQVLPARRGQKALPGREIQVQQVLPGTRSQDFHPHNRIPDVRACRLDPKRAPSWKGSLAGSARADQG
jgi:hypothetical protein